MCEKAIDDFFPKSLRIFNHNRYVCRLKALWHCERNKMKTVSNTAIENIFQLDKISLSLKNLDLKTSA